MVKSNQVLDSLNALHCVLTELVVGYFLDLKGKERSSDPNTSVNFSRRTAPLLLFIILILLVVN